MAIGTMVTPWVYGAIFALTVLKGARMPNRWSVTQYLFNYDSGFMKRALVGDLLSRVFGGWTAQYFFLAAVALALVASLLGIWLLAVRRLLDEPDRVPFLLVFLSSPAITMAVHLAGYLEQVGYLLLGLALVVPTSWRWQVAVAAACAIVTPLVHEASLFWTAPLFTLLVMAGPQARSQPRAARLTAAGVVAMLWVATTGVVVTQGTVSSERMQLVRDRQTAFADVRPRQDAFATLSTPADENVAEMRRRWATSDIQIEMVYSVAVFGPALVLLMALALGRARRVEDAVVRRWSAGLVMLVVSSPLLLHSVGWDMHRWNALAAFNAGCAALILLLPAPGAVAVQAARGALSPRWWAAALVVMVWSVSADVVFFDGYHPAHPPFSDQIEVIINGLESGDFQDWIPRQGN